MDCLRVGFLGFTPRPFPVEFRRRAVALVWGRQDQIDRGGNAPGSRGDRSSGQAADVADADAPASGIVHAHHGVQITFRTFTNKIRASGSMPLLGTGGDCYLNPMRAPFWSSMRIELLNRKKWHTPVDLANTMFEKLGDASPIEYELPVTQTSIPTRSSHRRRPPTYRARQSLKIPTETEPRPQSHGCVIGPRAEWQQDRRAASRFVHCRTVAPARAAPRDRLATPRPNDPIT